MSHLPTAPELDEQESAAPLMSAMNQDRSIEDDLAEHSSEAEQKRIATQSALLIAIVAVVAGGILFTMKVSTGGQAATASAASMAKIETFLQKAEQPELLSETDPMHPKNLEAMFETSAIVQKIATDYSEKGVEIDELQKNPFAMVGPAKKEAAVADTSEADRTRRLGELRREAEDLDLQSMMGSGSRSVAVIDGKFYRVGDQLGSFKVARMAPGKVLLVPEGIERRQGEAPFVLGIAANVPAADR